MTQVKLKQQQRLRRVVRLRARISGTPERPRLVVKRSLAHIYAQVIDDSVGRVLATASDLSLEPAEIKGKKKTELAALVGSLLAKQATAKGVTKVVFDRRDKKYHGRVKALADGARQGGLEF